MNIAWTQVNSFGKDRGEFLLNQNKKQTLLENDVYRPLMATANALHVHDHSLQYFSLYMPLKNKIVLKKSNTYFSMLLCVSYPSISFEISKRLDANIFPQEQITQSLSCICTTGSNDLERSDTKLEAPSFPIEYIIFCSTFCTKPYINRFRNDLSSI